MKPFANIRNLFTLAMLLLIIAFFLNILIIPFATPYLNLFAILYGEDSLIDLTPSMSFGAALALTLKSALNILVAVWIFLQAKRKGERPLTWTAFALFYGVFALIALYLKVMAKELYASKAGLLLSNNQKPTFSEISFPKISGIAVLLLIIAFLGTQLGNVAHKFHQIWFGIEGAIPLATYMKIEAANSFNTLSLLTYLNILAAFWVFKEASQHKENAILWAFLTLFFGVFSISALYLIILGKECQSILGFRQLCLDETAKQPGNSQLPAEVKPL